jgi:hypothetical protein
MKYTVELSSGGIIYVPRLMTNRSGIRVIFGVLHQQFERL